VIEPARLLAPSRVGLYHRYEAGKLGANHKPVLPTGVWGR
jgi:hypothetical protein